MKFDSRRARFNWWFVDALYVVADLVNRYATRLGDAGSRHLWRRMEDE